MHRRTQEAVFAIHQVDGPGRVEEPSSPLDDRADEAVTVELGRELPLDVREGHAGARRADSSEKRRAFSSASAAWSASAWSRAISASVKTRPSRSPSTGRR